MSDPLPLNQKARHSQLICGKGNTAAFGLPRLKHKHPEMWLGFHNNIGREKYNRPERESPGLSASSIRREEPSENEMVL